MVGETARHRFDRLARQADKYPELANSTPKEVFSVDRMLREQGQQPTTPGQEVESAYMQRSMEKFRSVDRQSMGSRALNPIDTTDYLDFRSTEMAQRPNPEPDSGNVLERFGGFLGDSAKRVPSDILNTLGVVGTQLQRPQGAVLGSIRGMEDRSVWQAPLGAVEGAITGFRDPNDFGGGAESSLGQRVPEKYRGAAGLAIETLFDPIDLITGGTVGTDLVRAGARTVRGMSDDATQAAIRAVDSPLETSTRYPFRQANVPATREFVPWQGPPVEEGYVRLFRGEAPRNPGNLQAESNPSRTGRWFTRDLSEAENYSRDPVTGMATSVKYIDVPESSLDDFMASPLDGSGQVGEYVLPADLAAQAKNTPRVRGEFVETQGSSTGAVDPVIPGVSKPIKVISGAAEEHTDELMRFTGGELGTEVPIKAPPEPTIVSRLTESISNAKPLQEQNRELLSDFRRKQAEGFRGAIGEGESGFYQGMGAMRGTADRVGFQPLRDGMEQVEIDNLFNAVKTSRLRTFEQANAGSALQDILNGVVPTPSELKQLESVFPGVKKALQDANIVSESIFDTKLNPTLLLQDLLSMPQALRSAFDISYLRQTATAAYGHPMMFARSFGRVLEAAASEKNFRRLMDDIDNRWHADIRREAKVAIENSSEMGLTKGEGSIISDIVNKVPGFRQSQRAYIAGLNIMRDGLFKSMLDGYGDDIAQISPKELERWGNLVNVSTGRGTMGGILADSKAFSTPIFWAPRLVAARAEMPLLLFSRSPQVRKEAARQIASFVGVNSAILYAGQKSGAWDVEIDPRSADFGQARIGNQRIDPWAGFRPLANLYTRMTLNATNKAGVTDIENMKSSTSGEAYDAETKDIVANFLRSKFSPVTSVGVNVWTGKDAIGNPYGFKNVPGDTLVSLFLSDLNEAARNGGPAAAGRALLGGVGLGVNTYEINPFDTAALEMGFDRPYRELMPAERLEVDDANPELVQARSEERIARGGPQGEYELMRSNLNNQQLASDYKFITGEMSPQQWRDDRKLRLAELRGAGEVAFADIAPKDKTVIDKYRNVLSESETPEGKVDWDLVDRYIAGLSEADQAIIDKNTGLGGTPTEREYREAIEEIEESGFFAMQDSAWEMLSEAYGIPTDKYPTYNVLFNEIASDIEEGLIESGIAPGVARTEARMMVANELEIADERTDLMSEMRTVWAANNISNGVADKATLWGYYDPTVDVREAIMVDSLNER